MKYRVILEFNTHSDAWLFRTKVLALVRFFNAAQAMGFGAPKMVEPSNVKVEAYDDSETGTAK